MDIEYLELIGINYPKLKSISQDFKECKVLDNNYLLFDIKYKKIHEFIINSDFYDIIGDYEQIAKFYNNILDNLEYDELYELYYIT